MLKKLMQIVVFTFVFAVGTICANAAVGIFNDDFNSYTAGKGLGSESGGAWVSRGGSVAEGDLSRGNIAKIEDNDESNIMYISTTAHTKEQNEYIVYIWDYMTENPTNDQRMIIYGVTSGGEEKKVIQLRTYQADGGWRLEYQDGSSGGWAELCGFEAGKWYHFRAEVSYTGSSGSIALYVNGTEMFANHTVMQTAVIAAPQHKLLFGTNTNKADTGIMYIDNVSVSSLGSYSELFTDDFNSYTAGKGLGSESGGSWVSKGGSVAEGKDGNWAKVTDESDSDSMYISAPKQSVSEDVITYEWDYMSDTLSADQRVILSGINSDDSEKKIIQIKTAQTDEGWVMQYQNSGVWADLCGFETGVWYHFELTVDFQNRTTGLSVNGESIFSGGGFMANAAAECPEHRITFGMTNAKSDKGVMYIDNVRIITGEMYSEYPDLSNITYYCNNGDGTKAITALESGEIIVKTKLVNLGNEAKNAVVITALYRGDELIDFDMHTGDGHSNKTICFEPETVNNLYCIINADIPAEDTADWTLKTFLWDSENTLSPLCKAENLKR